MRNGSNASRRLPTRRARSLPVNIRVIGGLFLLIVVGTVLLLLPGIAARPLSFMEAAFTATSAVTVTGLAVTTTSTDFTFLGQVILLLLIQIGGLGYMVMAALALRLLGRRVSLLDRLALSSSLGLSQPRAILTVVRRALVAMLIFEGIGAVLLYVHWRYNGIVAPENAAFYAIFHAVSAFCNAGFDLFAGLEQYPRGIPGDSTTLLIMGVLIILGSLGIPVIGDLVYWRFRKRLSLHSRVTLAVVAVLIVFGWIGLLIAEVRPGSVLHEAPLSQQLVHTWFQSVSARTAGFPGLDDFNQIRAPSRLMLMGLMFIGSAPASMGGGITTGTFSVLTLALFNYARGRPQVQVSGRTISTGTVRRASAVLTISVGLVFFASWLILLTHEFSFSAALFEVVSAFATCGLSLGITPALNPFGRLIIMMMMFWGRLGALTIVIGILQRRHSHQLVEYPEESILI